MLNFDIDEDLLSEVCMEWAKPKYKRKEINEAGEYLVSLLKGADYSESELDVALGIVDNFRAAHAFPLNTFQVRLRAQANHIDRNSIVAQRLKRLSSILFKLDRFKMMELCDMQDIGGCRAVVSDLKKVEQLVDAYKLSRIRHRLSHEDDYIKKPRTSGYRSRHLVYRYISESEISKIYNGLRLEIQIRTPLQHAWATTVETVDAFTKQALKASRGSRGWKRFFKLMGTYMAFREDTPPVLGTPTDIRELRQELRNYANELQVIKSLAGFTTALRVTERPSVRDAYYYLLYLDNINDRLKVTGYTRRELTQASNAYAKIEKLIRNTQRNDAVLVSVDSIRNLRRAYPNYFADTSTFVAELNRALR
jgi:hypothetical protein